MMRILRGTGLTLAGTLLLAACNQQPINPIGVSTDTQAPVLTISKTLGDTITVPDGISFSVGAADNLGLATVSIAMTGGFTGRVDTTFNTAVTSVSIPVGIPLPENTTAGGTIVITATAVDGNDNVTTVIDSLFLVNSQALTVRLLRPSAGAVSSPGLQILIEVQAVQQSGVRTVGYTVAGVVTDSNSIGFSSPLPDSGSFVDTLLVPSGTSDGTFDIVGFAEDSSARRAASSPVTVTVQSVQNDQDPPLVTVQIAGRVEVRDSITVRATDPSGIQTIGWEAREIVGGTVVGGGTTTVGGTLTEGSQQYNLDFNFATLPQTVEITAFGIDANGNRGETSLDGVQATASGKVDTAIVVFGITKPLPVGGRVADAVYNRNLNEVYLTNVELNRLEIFQVTDTSFVTSGIPIGSRPWGIALWPQDTLGANANQIMVANSGGTNISIVDVGARQEVRRHTVPNFIIEFVQTELDPATNLIKIKIERQEFSDRPQNIGAVCLPTTGTTTCAADSIYAVYSTTPTISQFGTEFIQRGSVRWENLTAGTPQSHFFWEHSGVPPSPDSDTLQVIVDRGAAVATDTVLSAACGITVDRRAIAFADTTFVRNSGNFTRAVVGEGGIIEPSLGFGRALTYDVNGGITQAACAATVAGVNFTGRIETDIGISPPRRSFDWIGNTGTAVRGVAVNFNGLTNLVRADSIYVIDEDLKLVGIVQIAGGNPGMDLNFDHAFGAKSAGTPTFGGTGDPNDRLLFAATNGPNIEVYDTFFYGRVATIPVRDPVIGPLRVARLGTGEQFLIGVTARGVVTIRLPAVANVFPIVAGGQ